MTQFKDELDSDSGVEVENDTEIFPVEPRYHPIHKIPRKIYDFLASAKLAMFLLVTILVCCVAGVTIWHAARAWDLIFSAIWFNALLVLLVINIACCFFGRIWHRKITVISFGMILFHVSFVTILLAVVYNSLFYFKGNIRLTEGEVLLSGDPQSYDIIENGRFFSFSRLKGETTLVKMHIDYKVNGDNKRAAYEVEVGEAGAKSKGIVYITHKLTHKGFDYFNDREGYSLLVNLADRQGKDVYGAFIPLQSIKQPDKSYMYVSGFKDGNAVKASPLFFPHQPEKPQFALLTTYFLSKLKERGGEVEFQLFALDDKGAPLLEKPVAVMKKPVGEFFAFGDHQLAVTEVRYWVGMVVRYEPGKPIVLTSLWVALAGMFITTVGRMFRKSGR